MPLAAPRSVCPWNDGPPQKCVLRSFQYFILEGKPSSCFVCIFFSVCPVVNNILNCFNFVLNAFLCCACFLFVFCLFTFEWYLSSECKCNTASKDPPHSLTPRYKLPHGVPTPKLSHCVPVQAVLPQDMPTVCLDRSVHLIIAWTSTAKMHHTVKGIIITNTLLGIFYTRTRTVLPVGMWSSCFYSPHLAIGKNKLWTDPLPCSVSPGTCEVESGIGMFTQENQLFPLFGSSWLTGAC